MQVTRGLKRVLSTLADHYLQDGNEAGVDGIQVRFTDETPHADTNGQYVAVNPDVRDTYGRSVGDVTELRIIVDTLAHEVEHVNQSDLASKEEVAKANPDMPQTAGMVANILEDAYIDEQRMQRNPGQRVSHNVKIDALMDNHHRRPRVDTLVEKEGLPRALVETALQVTAAGYAKGVEDLSNDHPLVEFAARWTHVAQEAREAHDVDDRLDVIQGGIDLLRHYAPDNTTGRDMDEAAEEQGGGNLFDDDEAPDPSDMDLDPEDLERDTDVSEKPDADDTPGTDDLADDLDDLGDDGWGDGDGDEGDGDTNEAEADMDGMGDPSDMDGDGPDPDADADGDTDADTPEGDAAGDTDADGDTSRVDALLDEYDPTDLEVVR
jgi:hypothetical protein